MRYSNLLLLWLLSALLFTHCNKPPLIPAGTVYCAGYEYERVHNSNASKAILWKNGTATVLAASSDFNAAFDVFVSGKDVYAAGILNTGSTFKPVYWKNGIVNFLPSVTDTCSANSIFVIGNNVYNAGGSNKQAVLWKNLNKTNLPNQQVETFATSLYVSGHDTYIAGQTLDAYYNGYSTQQKSRATIWKNGLPTYLTDFSSDAVASSVYVQDCDVYVSGTVDIFSSKSIPMLWKNGKAIPLPANGYTYAQTNGVFAANGDVYVCGSVSNGKNRLVTLWKNGILNTITDGSRWEYPTAIYVDGRDVYICGMEEYVDDTGADVALAKYWKNGIATYLGDKTKNNYVNSIFVK